MVWKHFIGLNELEPQACLHIEAETKLQRFYREHFKIHFMKIDVLWFHFHGNVLQRV